jgi:MFS family permease
MDAGTHGNQIRHARRQFLAMAGAFALGVFNENFYKQAAAMLAVAAGMAGLQSWACIVFTLPFLLLAPFTGWLADRFPKRGIVIGAKWMELAAMLVGAVGICLVGQSWLGWPLVFLMLFLIGAQASAFSPALNGSIPELYPDDYVAHANGVLRTVVNLGIMAGTALAGVALSAGEGRPCLIPHVPNGQLAVGVIVVAAAILGLVLSYGVPARPAAAPQVRFPKEVYAKTFRDLGAMRQDPPLAVAVAATVFIFILGWIEFLIINKLGITQYGLSKAATGGLVAAQLVGIGGGGLVAARLTSRGRWFRTLLPAGLLMACALLAVAAVPHFHALSRAAQLVVIYSSIGLVGIGGGLFLVPADSFIQVRAEADRKGAVLAAVNFVVFSGMLLGLLAFLPINKFLKPTDGMGLLGVFALLATLVLFLILRRWGDIKPVAPPAGFHVRDPEYG